MDDRFNFFTNIISSIYRSIHLIKDEETEKHGLKSTHVSCIYNIYKNGSLSQLELIEICQENKAAISRTISFLIEGGYIKVSGEGKYKKSYSLTDKGNEIATIFDNRINDILLISSCDVSLTDREIMYKSLEKIDNNLKRIIKK